ncbi:MAG: hypothetical protein Q8L86_16870 [Vicinamibacterales bacterium]|nr:hypothetical protein [Vicinamibacterales bacterium]
MASSFGDDPSGDDRTDDTTPNRDTTPKADAPAAEAAPVSAAQERFLSCRWRRPAEPGGVDCCGHRDVLPMAGTTGFQAEAWCTDCALYKAKRAPRKREETRPSPIDDYWRR